MSVYIITGKLGGGKTLCSVGLIRDALLEGRKVATNIDLNLEFLLPWQRKNVTAYRLPDKLSSESFETIGHGNPDTENGIIDEERNGLLVLDEGGLALNSRDYREAGRKEFIRWAVHSRKNGWHMAIIIQHVDALDKQIRDMFGEHVVSCSRLDNMRIPMVGWLLQLFGFKGTLGKMHKATCRYGQQHNAVKTWVKWFQGKDLYHAFNTRQTYDPEDENGVFQYLPPWHVKGRYHNRFEEMKDGIRETWQLYALAPVGRLTVFFCAALLGGWVHASFVSPEVMTVEAAQKESVIEPIPFEQIDDLDTMIQQEVDPWEHAYISSYVGNSKNGYGKYKFRSGGIAIQLPVDAAMIPISPCAVILQTVDRSYNLYCRKQ